jgi:uncharacterized protein YlzI (FlbEa/FlbD family)
MKAILSEEGVAFNATEYISTYGNERLLRLQRAFTIRTVDRTTKIPQVTKLFRMIRGGGTSVIELPRFALRKLQSKSPPSATAPITSVECHLPTHSPLTSIAYTGQSNANQQVVVQHVVHDLFANHDHVAGATLKVLAGCHAVDTGILMASGEVRRVQDVQVGDKLMGDDSTPRTVLQLVRGRGQMYRLANMEGESYVVNEDHVLCLKCMNDRVVEMTVGEFAALDESVRQHLMEYKTGVEYPAVGVSMDPYTLGRWLGDVTRSGAKLIPPMYKINSRDVRLKLLAGLLDADGVLRQSGGSMFEFMRPAASHASLLDDMLDIARSLGFGCYKSYVAERGATRLSIYGHGIERIPTLCNRPDPRRHVKDALVSKLSVEKLGDTADNRYFGFQVSGNQRYLMSSFTVTHNCGKTYIAMDIMGKMKLKTLIVVMNTDLLEQWTALLSEYFPTASIGTLYGKRKCDGDIIVGIINTVSDLKEFTVTEKKPVPNVGATQKYASVKRTVDVDDLLRRVGLTVFDESHMYVSKEFRKVFRRIHSRFTIGLTATPDQREDKLDAVHQAWVGPIVDAETLDGYSASRDAFESDAKLIEYYARNEHCKFNVRDDGIIDYSSIVESIVSDPYRNELIVEEVLSLMQSGHFTFVFSDRRSHLEHLYDLLEMRCNELQTPAVMEIPEASRKVILYGGSSKETIDKAKRVSKVIFTTYAYSSTGVSIVTMNALVLATPRRSNMKQIINRVFRLGSDRTVRRKIVDVVDAKLPLKGQVRERVKAYAERGSSVSKKKVLSSAA